MINGSINQLKEDLLVALHNEQDRLEAERERIIKELDFVDEELYRIQDLIYKLG